MAERAVAIDRKALSPDRFHVVPILATFASIRSVLGKAVEARQGFDDSLAIGRRRSPDGSPQLARMLWLSATSRMGTKEPAELRAALRELEDAVAMAQKSLPPGHPSLKEYGDTLARCKAELAGQDKPGDTPR